MTILLWGARTDTPLLDVAAALERQGAGAVVLHDEDAESIAMEYTVKDRLQGTLRHAGGALSLDDVHSMYLRPSSDADPEAPVARHRSALLDMLYAWAEESPGTVINRSSAAVTNASKPHQLRMIRDAGFDVPATLLTTSPEEVASFAARFGALVYKSISGTRSIVSTLDPSDPRLSRLTCPTQFQERVSGIEYRVHVVGERVFGCAIESTADDYRYARRFGAERTMKQVTIDDALAERCVRLTRRLGLLFSGIDLKRTPEGREVCFEVNTSPGFSFFDDDGAIAEAVATLLVQGL